MSDWGPIQQENMSIFIESHNRDDAYEYIERETVYCEIGLIDGPIGSFDVKRGASDKEIEERLKMLRETKEDYDAHFGEKNEARLKQFVKTPESELYMVFCEDCKSINPPMVITKEEAGVDIPNWFREFTDEWNVLANWMYLPKFLEVWDRRKISYLEAVERIKKMQVLPPKPKKLFTVDPKYKQRIDELLPKLKQIDDEDNAPYKLVVEQKKIKDDLKQLFAILASKKFMLLIGGYKPPYVVVDGYYPYKLYFEQCEYDNWHGWYDFFKKYCKISDWDAKEYRTFPIAFWDISNDSDFAQSEQKIFEVQLSYYGAHASGY